MLFSGSSRIADVLPFGTLRNVVSLRQTGKEASVAEEKKSGDPQDANLPDQQNNKDAYVTKRDKSENPQDASPPDQPDSKDASTVKPEKSKDLQIASPPDQSL